ncbi:MAG: hypothetical protein CBE00_02960 [Planctomycetaceae bacterium TMED240]|nr:hypothetical protein [Rhodopirellula sp.]OUX08026.1 MAG: hypothetical protein CBE00_02960 [Planctomycetaceae bacterium TMED240]
MVIPAQGLQVDNRILQFVPDPSVLNVTPTDSEQTESVPTTTPSDRADQPDTFQKDDWIPGKVKIATGINPIAPLSGSGSIFEEDGETDAFNENKRRLWVCEIVGDSSERIRQNPFVVVSPFEDIGDTALLARACASVINAVPDSTLKGQQPTSLTSTGQEN